MSEVSSQAFDAKKNPAATKKARKKLPLIVRFFRAVLIIVAIFIVLLFALFAFCALDRKSPISAIPGNFSAYVRTDDAFSTLNPLLDIHAADVAFASVAELKKFRPLFMNLRSSALRKNVLVKLALARSASAALYEDDSFVFVVDLGFLSFLTRPLTFAFSKMPSISDLLLKNGVDIQFVKDEILPHFVLKSVDEKGKETITYLLPVKNLVCASSSLDTLLLSVGAENGTFFSETQKKAISGKVDGIKIVMNARKLAQSFTQEDDVLGSLGELLPYDALSEISVKITDSDIFLDCSIPISKTGDTEKPSALDSLLEKKSTVPSVLSTLGDLVQYCTILNAGSLSELKDALFPILPVKDATSLWGRADFACRLAFGLGLDELVFSWTGVEFAAFGIENQNDPVFAIQIKDEKKRREVFEKFVSSIFIKDDNSLILGGVRLPRLKLPGFLTSLLSLFGVEIPSPYYMVLGDFIYFSESPESLSAVFSSRDSGQSLLKSEGWKTVSSGIKNDSSITLFYDLAHSAPFFIRKNAGFSDVLKLYSLGRFDAKFKGNSISLLLKANSKKSESFRAIPGFPIIAAKNANPESLVLEGGKNPTSVFFSAGNSVNALDTSSLELKSVENVGRCALCAASGKVKDGVLWAVSEGGNVYLCDKNLSVQKGFPVSLGEKTSGSQAGIAATENGLLIPLESGKIVFVDYSAKITAVDCPPLSLKSAPSVCETVAAVYDKSFFGGVYVIDLKTLSAVNSSSPLLVDGIGFGSPSVMVFEKKTYTAFITQAGFLTIWEGLSESQMQNPVIQKQLDGTFEGKIVSSGTYFYALSTDATLHRISVSGDVLSVKIPHASAKNAHICVLPIGKNKKGVFVNADSNVIYAFNEDLELLPRFPLSGSGIPVLLDVDGDKIDELISITLDKKIVAWKMR